MKVNTDKKRAVASKYMKLPIIIYYLVMEFT